MNNIDSQVPPTELSKRLPITAVVVGLISIPAPLVMGLGGVSFGLVAIAIGAVALSNPRRGRAAGSRIAVVGIATGVLGIVSTVAVNFLFGMLTGA